MDRSDRSKAHAEKLTPRGSRGAGAALHIVAQALAALSCASLVSCSTESQLASGGAKEDSGAPARVDASSSQQRDEAGAGGSSPSNDTPIPSPDAGTADAEPTMTAASDAGPNTGPTADAGPAPALDAGTLQATGGFQVTPWAIYDPEGNEYLPRGADVAGPGMWWSEKVQTETHQLVDCWQFNMVRLLISYNGAQGDHNTIDETVSYFTAKKIVVVIATVDNPTAHWTDSQFSSPTGAYQTWLRNIATKYKNNPYVWYSIVGENGTCDDCTSNQWVPSNQQLLKVMRDDAGASNVFLSLGSTWGQEAGCTSGFVPTAKSCFLSWGDQLRSFGGKDYTGQGVAYELHPYEQWDSSDGESRLANYIDRNQAMGNYLWFSDYAGSNGGGASSLNTLQYVVDLAQSRRLALGGMWSFPGDPTGTPGDCLCTPGCSSGATINDCANPTNLTWLGQKLWANSHRDESRYPSNIRTPVPAHSATTVSTGVTIAWNAVPTATSYDVYFGTSNTPGQAQLVGNQTGTSWKPPTLQANTNYYWRVNPKNQNGTTVGGVMHFRTGS